MKKCVIYYNRGEKCTIRLIVSIASLRKHWSGDIVLAHEGPVKEYLKKRLDTYGVIYRETKKSTVNNALADKPTLYKYVSDYDLVLYVDSDTLFLNAFDEIWDILDRYGFMVTNFCDWITRGGTISRRIKQWVKVLPEEEIEKALSYGNAVNTGVFGFSKKYVQSEFNIFLEWHDLTIRGQEENCTRRMVDELACQVLLHKYPHIMLNFNWNMSAKFGKINDEIKIVHYHGYKHVYKEEFPLCVHWYVQYMKLVDDGFININDIFGDRRLKNAPWRKGRGWDVN